ncbi:MAG: UDP-glucose--hexose-1-phosphate uridylyltransferase [Treponema sp.]|nr:UDP-glucose--hexose-1-phosphate uridylyltransferase [Treponema sp.]
MTIFQNINRLVSYALKAGLITKEDITYTQNRLLELLRLDGFEEGFDAQKLPAVKVGDLENILKELLDWAAVGNVFEDTGVASRDLFDTKIMGLLVPPPSDVIDTFNTLATDFAPQKATDWFYKFSQDTDYIRRYRVCKDLKWKAATPYGSLDITINLSKPEKDPKAIAAAKLAKQSGYPKCLLCAQNEGYAGRLNHPARQNHRIIPLTLNGEDWALQYSPYVYYNEHCIVLNKKHVPMKICRATFDRLLDFVTQFPHYTLGSNADLPIVGGSILAHDHFQGGNYEFAMARAPIEAQIKFEGFSSVKAGIVKWPMSVIRLDSKDKESLASLAEKILKVWRAYTDKAAFVFAKTEGVPHNTITPIARRRGELYELDLVLRNNITTEEHPLGVYHPHAELHHIKKENIGLIEVMGLAVLPPRLKVEMQKLAAALVAGTDIASDELLAKHAEWANELKKKYKFTKESTDKILRKEIAIVFSKVLEHAGVYKRDADGKAAFLRFVQAVNKK